MKAKRISRWTGKALVGLGITTSAIAAFSSQYHTAQAAQVIRIGYQQGGTLDILKERGTFDAQMKKLGYQAEWTQFPGGPQLLDAMNANSIDIGETGEAPPIFAQAAGTPLVYIDHSAAEPKAEAVVVKSTSSIHTIQQLKGKSIALNKGSNVNYLLVQVLKKAGLKYSDIHPVYLAPAQARAAFERGSVDAWVIWDPYLSAVQVADHVRVVSDGTGLVANQQFDLAARAFAQTHPSIVQQLISDLNETDLWTKTHQSQVVTILHDKLGIDVPSLKLDLSRRTYGVYSITNTTILQQQAIADAFYQIGLIPNRLVVKQDTLPQFVSK